MYLSKRYSFLLFGLALLAITAPFIKTTNKDAMKRGVNRYLFAETNLTCAQEIQDAYECEKEACEDKAGFINYLYLLECSIPEEHESWLKPITYTLVILWDLLLLNLLVSTADHFFCPIIETIVTRFHMSPNFAGVTFLSLGIGAADLFTLVSSFNHGSAGLAIGQNLGSDVFIVTIIVSCITLAARTIVKKQTFLRDSIIFFVALIYLFIVIEINEVNIYMALGFLLFYCCYILLVCIHSLNCSPKDYNKLISCCIPAAKKRDDVQSLIKNEQTPGTPLIDMEKGNKVFTTGIYTPESDPTSPAIRTPLDHPLEDKKGEHIYGVAIASVLDVINDDEDRESDHDIKNAVDMDFAPENVTIQGLLKHEWSVFKQMSILSKINYVIMIPFSILRKGTIPMVDRENYSKFWLVISSFMCFFIIAINFDLGLFSCLIPYVPNIIIVLIFSSILAFLSWKYTKATEVPHGVFSNILMLFGFFTAANWTAMIADEIVSLFQALGYVTGISPIILGVTILSWGTGANDLVSDVTLAKQGYPEMSITACFAGPLFNIYVGMGSGMVSSIINSGENIVLGQKSPLTYIAFATIFIALLANIIIVPITHYEFRRWFSLSLIGVYILFMAVTLLHCFGLFF
ncbi:hypothetical protein WA158_005311 [Blastocystis sp. Blastoise]